MDSLDSLLEKSPIRKTFEKIQNEKTYIPDNMDALDKHLGMKKKQITKKKRDIRITLPQSKHFSIFL
jgi:predicted  nucleic acid-binding Zn-ribbon protein